MTDTPTPTDRPAVIQAGERTAWQGLELAADTSTGDEGEDGFNIGRRDGFSEAVQLIDQMTGGNGEYRYCTDHDPERHCPDPDAMIARIADRLATEARLSPAATGNGSLFAELEAFPNVSRVDGRRLHDVIAEYLPATTGKGAREAVIEQLVAEGRAKHRVLNDEQQEAADDEARSFYRKVIDRYIAALPLSVAKGGEQATGADGLREALAQAVDVLERLPYGDWPGKMYSGKVAAANGLIRRARAALAATPPTPEAESGVDNGDPLDLGGHLGHEAVGLSPSDSERMGEAFPGMASRLDALVPPPTPSPDKRLAASGEVLRG